LKAMVLAAGRGTRLGKITDETPKCLVQAGGKTLLRHVVVQLKKAGVTSLVINLHHLADQVKEYVESADQFGIEVAFTYETELLDTGGGILNARDYLESEDFFIVHNADIYSEIDLSELVKAHVDQKALATLATVPTTDPRRLLFAPDMVLVGWENTDTGKKRVARSVAGEQPFGFCGVSVYL